VNDPMISATAGLLENMLEQVFIQIISRFGVPPVAFRVQGHNAPVNGVFHRLDRKRDNIYRWKRLMRVEPLASSNR
jgi:hypothetical protein